MIILDTDCLSLLDRERLLESSALRRKLDEFSPDEITTTIITFEEHMRGWLSYIAKAKNLEEQVRAYRKLHRFLESYRNSAVLDFDEAAAKTYQDLRAQKIRIGAMDLKIASIALACRAILVPRNLRDFEQVPNLVVRDWTK